MCRVVAYLGSPLQLDVLLYRSDSALVRQAYDPKMLSFMNLAGCGVAAWDSSSPDPEVPFLYKDTVLPMFDRNLLHLSRKLRGECVIAHVRGANYFGTAAPGVERANLHPFRFGDHRLVMAHNGDLADFHAIKYDLLADIHPEVARSIEGTTDSEWIYALLLSRLRGVRDPDAEALGDAVEDTLRILRRARDRRGIATTSGVNLFVSDGRSLITTRFSFDYGCYSAHPSPGQLMYHSLWYTTGRDYGLHDDEWRMTGRVEDADSVLMASEPLARDTSTWIEVPEYTMLVASRLAGTLRISNRDLDI